MTAKIPDELIDRFSAYVAERMGLNFPPERRRDLEAGLRRAAPELGFPDAQTCVRSLLLAPPAKSQVEILASHLTVGETYFFRDRKLFELLETDIFPELIQKRRDAGRFLRVWSAGCATGEEPYSISILLRRMLFDLGDWNISILATDINPAFLQKASQGVYGEWSFRDCPSWLKERYFGRQGQGRYELLPEIRKRVTFSYHNLAEDHYPSLLNNTNAMDIIFCRNVLMYFSGDRQKQVVERFYHCLVDGGRLIVSPTEVSLTQFSPFVLEQYPGASIYRKDAKRLICPLPQRPLQLREEYPAAVVPALAPLVPPPDASVPSPPSWPPVSEEQEQADPYEEALRFYERGCYQDAEEKITGLLSQRSNHSPALALLSRVRANAGVLPDARALCERAIAADKLNPGYHYLLATILQEMGLPEDSAASLRRSVYLDSNFVLAHFSLGNLARTQGRTKEAGRHFENARSALQKFRPGDILPESEGVTAGRMAEIIGLMIVD